MNEPPLTLRIAGDAARSDMGAAFSKALAALGLGYIRCSTDRQELGAQEETVRRAFTYQRIEDVQIFAELGVSGSVEFLDRPEAAKLLNTAHAARKAGREVTIIVPKVDRLGRDTVDVSNTAELFDKMGVRLILLDINVDTRTAMGRAFMQIAAVFAELERARIRERIQAALDHKRGKAEICGGVPFGWDAELTGASSAKGVAIRRKVSNPAEQRWIRHMAQMRAAGLGYHSISKDMNRRGVATKKAGQAMNIRQGGDKLGTPGIVSGRWTAGKVRAILLNPTVQHWLASEQLAQQAA